MVLSAEGRTILIKTVEGGQLLFASQIYVFIISILYSFLRVGGGGEWLVSSRPGIIIIKQRIDIK